MNYRVLFAFGLTVISMSMLYTYDNRETWNHSYYIIVIFIVFWALSLLNRQYDRFKDSSKIVDLSYYRSQKKKAPESKQAAVKYSKKVTIYSSCEKTKIELIQSLLISNSIECYVSNRHAASILPSIEGINLEIKVKNQDLDAALKILEQYKLTN